MLKLGKVSKETKGTNVELMKIEDKIFCLPGNVYWKVGSGCPA